MKLNQTPNFRVEDFTSQQDWIGKLFIQLNPFIQNLSQIFDQNIDYASNIKSATQTFNIKEFTSTGFGMQWPYADAPVDVRVVSAFRGDNKTPTVLVCAWSYNASKNTITISNLIEIGSTSNTVANGTYSFTIRATV